MCAFASIWFDDEEASGRQANQWCHTLKHAGGRALQKELEALDVAGHPPAACEEHRRVCGYLGNHLSRTDYPRYRDNGWQIGSGTIESACKTVVNARFYGSRMPWSEPGTYQVCHVRALFKIEPSAWNHYWSNPRMHLVT